jgi:hypothetical protein
VIGNPQNALIAVRSGISLLPFLRALWPVALVGLGLNTLLLCWAYRRTVTAAGLVVPPPREPPVLQRWMLTASLVSPELTRCWRSRHRATSCKAAPGPPNLPRLLGQLIGDRLWVSVMGLSRDGTSLAGWLAHILQIQGFQASAERWGGSRDQDSPDRTRGCVL